MITDVPGVQVGHWNGDGTGVTVVLLPPDTVGSCEVRGGAPATRETALLDPECTVEQVDAVVLSGGSAFGLATADGVMRALADRGRGFTTRGGPVPIVPAAAIFDLAEGGDLSAVPGPEEGRAALGAAEQEGSLQTGRVGAGRGARLGKWRGGEHGRPGGLGSASARDGDVVVGALVVVNSVGDVLRADGTTLAGSSAPEGAPAFPEVAPFEAGNTTLAVVVTNARLTKLQCHLLAQSAHYGLARAIYPSHTRHDGDITFACATGPIEANFDRLRVLTTDATAEAIRNSVAYDQDPV
ncbi:MAG: P1 family peptidase [Acidimicrobiia bacterium]